MHAKPLTAETADTALRNILGSNMVLLGETQKREFKRILVRLAQDAYRRGYNVAAKVERRADHE